MYIYIYILCVYVIIYVFIIMFRIHIHILTFIEWRLLGLFFTLVVCHDQWHQWTIW